jgi:lipopolysaccharide/colanic/teichoic acid biosynthesis glycosyltransferase
MLNSSFSPATSSGAESLSGRGIQFLSAGRLLGRLRFQFVFGTIAAAGLPPMIYHGWNIGRVMHSPATINTVSGCFAAFLIALLTFRRVISFPGITVVGHVLPATSVGYGIVLSTFLLSRLTYTGVTFLLSYLLTTLFLFAVSVSLRSWAGRRFYVVPSPGLEKLVGIDAFEWVVLDAPTIPHADRRAIFIADLRADLGAEWEKFIADVAVAGHPVYHTKQIAESLTGQVEIEHLSENSFGSLIPNLGYRKLKRLVDLITALVALPVLLVPGMLIAVWIKLDSDGPVFFRQERRGYRGEVFNVVKFRTMADRPISPATERELAMTLDGDPRITRAGRFLRRTRIDEFPQIWNVLKGEMSWIGPRPEALSLSDWYMRELPFYHYRHIVRPGITGWAQVNQGHVADLASVFEKLHYDFYYIKNFSAWLDLLIVARTMVTVLSGRGAR